MILKIILLIASLQFIILIHELGHIIVAQKLGFKIQQVNIGLGRSIFKIKWFSLPFVIRLIPFGGYAEIENLTLSTRKWLSGIMIWLGGPLFNMILSIVIFSILNIVSYNQLRPRLEADQLLLVQSINGQVTHTWQQAYTYIFKQLAWGNNAKVNLSNDKIHLITHKNIKEQPYSPNVLANINLKPWKPFIPAIIDNVSPSSPAIAILQPGDQILRINYITINNWKELHRWIIRHPDSKAIIKVKRGDKIYSFMTKTTHQFWYGYIRVGKLGIEPTDIYWPKTELVTIQYPWYSSLFYACSNVYELTNLQMQLIIGIVTHKIPFGWISGPLGISDVLIKGINDGFIAWLKIVALLSMSIAIINILPIPGLDGGQILLITINRFTGWHITARVGQLLQKISYILIMLLVVQATINDIGRQIYQLQTTFG